jgi:hypothetical protein
MPVHNLVLPLALLRKEKERKKGRGGDPVNQP